MIWNEGKNFLGGFVWPLKKKRNIEGQLLEISGRVFQTLLEVAKLHNQALCSNVLNLTAAEEERLTLICVFYESFMATSMMSFLTGLSPEEMNYLLGKFVEHSIEVMNSMNQQISKRLDMKSLYDLFTGSKKAHDEKFIQAIVAEFGPARINITGINSCIKELGDEVQLTRHLS